MSKSKGSLLICDSESGPTNLFLKVRVAHLFLCEKESGPSNLFVKVKVGPLKLEFKNESGPPFIFS